MIDVKGNGPVSDGLRPTQAVQKEQRNPSNNNSRLLIWDYHMDPESL